MSENENINESNESLNENENMVFNPFSKKIQTYKTASLFFKFLYVFGMMFLISFFIFQIILTPIKIVGSSMQPTYNIKITSERDELHCDIVYYNKNDSYTNGDVVIVSNESQQYVQDESTNLIIKRIIGKPGDKITFFLTDVIGDKYYYDILVYDKDGNNITPDEKSYIKETMYFSKINYEYNHSANIYAQKVFANLANDHLADEDRKSTITIEDNKYFVMGDNRNISQDSRYFGSVKFDDIIGSVKLQVKYGQNIWIALFEKLKTLLSYNIIYYQKEIL